MIEISLSTALILYSAAVATGAIALWVYTELAVQRRFFVLKNQHLWRCAICAFVYLDDEAGHFSTCPRCHSINVSKEAQARGVQADEAPSAMRHADQGDSPRRNASKQKRKGARRGPRKRGR